MCGRFALNRGLGQLRAAVNAGQVVPHGRAFNPSNNIAPGQVAPIVAGAAIQLLSWGSNRGNINLINARSETVIEKFRDDIINRRCLVPADGYFEWDKSKQPHLFKHPTHDLMLLAGLYNGRGEFLILTREAVGAGAGIHHRMPIIFTVEQIPMWEGPHWSEMLREQPPKLNYWPVCRSALRPGSIGEECVRPLKLPVGQVGRLEEMVAEETQRKIFALL
jgi:putative SOS response-associated peptidase YedK